MKDQVDRLNPLSVTVLALLREGDMHPYEMKRLLQHRKADRLITLTTGSLYHAVSRLQEQGLLEEVGIDRDGNRPERTTYTLTDAGDEALRECVRRELGRVDRPVAFRVALAEAHNLERDEVVHLLNQRRSQLAHERDIHRDGLATAQSHFVAAQFLLEIDRQRVLLDAELDWLDDLILRLEHHDFGWGTAEIPAEHAAQYLEQRKAAQS